MADFPKIISVDDHVVEPPGVWQDRLPAKYREIGPAHDACPAGRDDVHRRQVHLLARDRRPDVRLVAYEDLVYPLTRLSAAVGFDRDEVKVTAITFDEMRPGCFDPVARLEDMDSNWTEASLSFPTFPRFCGQTFLEASDRELALLCVKAYNDWMFDEWCGGSNGR